MLKRRSKDDFKGRHFEAWLHRAGGGLVSAVSAQLPDLEEMFQERGFEVDHGTINRWVLAYAPLIEKRLRQFRRPHCGSVRIDETYVKIRGKWRYLSRAFRQARKPNRLPSDCKARSRCRQALLPQDAEGRAFVVTGKDWTDGGNTFPSRSRRQSTVDTCIRIRFIMSPNMFSKVSCPKFHPDLSSLRP